MAKMVGRRQMTSAYFDPEIYEALAGLGDRLGIPVAELIRQAVSDLLLRYRVQVKAPRRITNVRAKK
jgi:Ribbon-helix-helix domain